MEYLKEWMWWFFLMILSWFEQVGSAMVDTVIALMPVDWASSSFAAGFGVWWITANTWLPLSEGLAIYAHVLLFQTAVISLRWVFKIVPGMGG